MKVVAVIYNFFSVLIQPIVLLLVFLLFTLFFKQKKIVKIITILFIVMIYTLSIGVVEAKILSRMVDYSPLNQQQIKNNQALILLGGGLNNSHGSIAPKVIAYSRILEAYRIYHLAEKMGVHYTIFVSGGDPEKNGISEAEVYSRILQQMGVNSRDLVLETTSHNTYQNAKFIKPIIEKYQFKQYLLVTSGLHMKRSLLYFQNFGIDVIPAISDKPMPLGKWVPSAYNLALFEWLLHEEEGIGRLHLYNWLGIN